MKRLLLILALGLAGCASAPTSEEQLAADYGQPPSNYEKTIRDYLSTTLKDPYAYDIKFIFEPRKDWTGFAGTPTLYGYAVCANVNAKNSFGAYTGHQLTYFLIRNDQVVRAWGLSPGEETNTQAQCTPNKGFR